MSNKKALQMIGLTLAALLLAGCGGALAGLTVTSTPVPPTATPTPVPTLGNKQVLLVIQERFNESEYGKPRAMLEKKGAVVTVASLSLDVVKSYSGGKRVQPDISLSDVRAANYDAIVFVGGYPYDPNVPAMHHSTPNGGAAWTHALLSGSPAIDAVSVVSCTVPTDQRGVPRPIVQTSSDTPCDIGAFEHKLMNRAIVWRCFNETIWDEIRVC